MNMQVLINSGMAWRLEGAIGRMCMSAIESGACMLGTVGCTDYWGGYVPSRTEVKPGTKGSREFVVNAYGEEYAARLEMEGDNANMAFDEEEDF